MLAKLRLGCGLLLAGFVACLLLVGFWPKGDAAAPVVYVLPTPVPPDPVAPVQTLASMVFWGTGALIVAAWGVTFAARQFIRLWQAGLVYPEDGQWPAPQAALLAGPEGAALRQIATLGYHQAAVARAANTGVPAQLTYSPSHTALPAPPPADEWEDDDEPDAPAGLLPAGVPTFATLLAQGVIAPGRPLVLGWVDGAPLLGRPEQVFTGGVGGKGRSGKTRTAALIIGQMALAGARLLVIDPHRYKEDSLTRLIAPLLPFCLLPPAQTGGEIAAVLEYGEREMALRRAGQHLDQMLLLVVDEYTLVQRQGGALAGRAAHLIESVATEGGGMGFKGLICGQNWKGTRTGGTEVRQMLQSAWVCRSWAEQARYLVPDGDIADQAESLTPGRAIYVPPDDDPLIVGIPLIEQADLRQIAGLCAGLGGPVSARFSPVSAPFQPGAVSVSAVPPRPVPETESATESETGQIDPLKRDVVRTALLARAKYGDIIEQVWGVKAGGTAAYRVAYGEFQAIVAALIGAESEAP